MTDFWNKVAIGAPNDCWPFIAKSRTGNGYGVAWADLGRGKRTYTAHRVAFYLHAQREPVQGLDIMHACDSRLCCNPAHLSEGTRLENMRDCARKGRTRRTPTVWGETHHKAKLSSAQVADIRDALARGEGYGPIACRHGVRNEVIGCIARGETWMQRMAA